MEIEKLRELLNNMMVSDLHTWNEIMEVSQRLDLLIVDYYKVV